MIRADRLRHSGDSDQAVARSPSDGLHVKRVVDVGDFVRCEIARRVSAISPSFTFADLAPAAYGFSVRSCVTIQRDQSSRLEHGDALAQAAS